MICKFCSKELTNLEEEQGICFECLYSKASDSHTLESKVCSKCNQELDLSEFYKDKDKYDGYKIICKSCYSKYYTSKINAQKDKSMMYYRGKAKRKKEDWVPEVGRYYIYRKHFKQPTEDDLIIKIESVKKGDKYCVIDFEPIIPKDMIETQWLVSKSELHWTWKYEEIPKEQINK
jgi:hypothetical protein